MCLDYQAEAEVRREPNNQEEPRAALFLKDTLEFKTLERIWREIESLEDVNAARRVVDYLANKVNTSNRHFNRIGSLGGVLKRSGVR